MPILTPLARTLTYLFLRTRGGRTRFAIVQTLAAEPLNSHRLAQRLLLDYKTIQHHLKMLESFDVVKTSPDGAYGALHFVSPAILAEREVLDDISRRLGMDPIER